MSLLPPPGNPPGEPEKRHWLRPWLVVIGAAVLIALASGGEYAASQVSPGPSPRPPALGAGSLPQPALQLVSPTAVSGTPEVPSDGELTLEFSAPVAGAGVSPTVTPPLPGTWEQVSATTIAYVPSAPMVPSTTETVTVPGGPTGIRARDGATMLGDISVDFAVGPADTLRLQQLLAQLNYLPLSFTPDDPTPLPVTETAMDQQGSFAWRWTTLPPNLTSLWAAGQSGVITTGALMAFEEHSGLNPDGEAGPQVWAALLKAVAANTADPSDYTYVLVSKTLPENLTLWDNGSPTYSDVLVNTGVRGADTADGTFTVFEHVPSSRMVGTNPNGTHYDDPHVPWASYFNGGDALHGFVRPGYGYPQSNGCVEMPVATAATLYPLTPIGTLVTVIGP